MVSLQGIGRKKATKSLRFGTAIGALCAAAIAAHPVAAQDTAQGATETAPGDQLLKDLIPDAAVENPEDWAIDGADDGSDAGLDDRDDTALPPEAPMAPMPEISVAWPDDLKFAPLEPVAVDPAIQFAGDDVSLAPLATGGFTTEINGELILAFPENLDVFPVRSEFISRFKALSTIQQLSGSADSIAQLAARARADEALLIEMLRVYGYYDAQVIRAIGEARDGADTAQVRFDIVPGVRYQFGAIGLGRLASAPDAEALRTAFEIQSGDPLSSDKIVEEKAELALALGETGYPFAQIGEAELEIDHREAAGDLTMPVDPNGQYRFAGVTSSLPDFLSGSHLASIARFEPGDTYRRSLEEDLRRAITATGLVSSVNITPREVEAPSGTAPGTVELDVDLAKAPLRTIAGAIGYGSEEGFRLQASWEHRNLFPPEGALKVRGILGTQEQLAGVTFRKNNFGGRDRILSLDAFASTIDSDAFDARTVAFVATYEQVSTLLFQKPFSWSVGFEAIATGERPPTLGGATQPRQTFFIGALPVSALIDTSDDLLNPTEGFRLGARISPEISRTNGAESFYLRSQIDASYYNSVSDGVVLAGRTRIGSIPGAAIDNIAPSRRLYSGGGSSVRGYGFQQIGPRDVEGEPSGGRSVVEFSLEARVKTGLFGGALSVVPFFDAGSVSDSTTPDFKEIRYGAGLGIRYDSGFGPIRVDVGTPLNPGPNDNPVAVYVSLGQAF